MKQLKSIEYITDPKTGSTISLDVKYADGSIEKIQHPPQAILQKFWRQLEKQRKQKC